MIARSVRPARPEDAAVLAEAERVVAETPGLLASRPEEIRDDDVLRKIVTLDDPARGAFLVAEEGGAIVGHGYLRAYDLAVTAHVADVTLVVHEGHQGRGVGRSLLEALIDRARASPRIEKIELRVRASNDRAIALYRAAGFVEEGRFEGRIQLAPGTYVDDVAMRLWVKGPGATRAGGSRR